MSSTREDAIGQGERIEGATWESVWEAAPEALREELGLSFEREGLVTICRASKVPSSFFNRMTGLGLEGPAQREKVDAQLDRFGESRVPYAVCLVADAKPTALPEWLGERGLVRTTTLSRMVRTTEDLPDPGTDVLIRPAGREDARLFAETTALGFSMPGFCVDWFARLCGREGWRTYLAYESGKPVGAGALCVHGKVGWLGFGCTLPEHRGRGIQGAMMARRMVDAADLGCRWLQTETNLAVGDEPTPSLDNMKRLGFQMAYERPNYTFTPPSA